LASSGCSANASSTFTAESGTATTTLFDGATAHTIQFATGAAVQTVTIGSTNSTSKLTFQGGVITTTNNQAGVIIGSGFSTSATSLIPLTLSSSTTFAEASGSTVCTTTVNGGALYYNSTQASGTQGGSSAVRACINGAWEDLVSTAGLGIMLFGVVPDSGSQPGDLVGAAATAHTTGPCKAFWASATTVTVNPCVAYSGGRKVVVASTTVTIPTTNTNWVHICLTGTNNGPAASATSTSEVITAQLPTFSITNPVLCLADVSTSASAITGIYDVRTFTTSTKEFVITAASLGLGWIACPTTASQVTTCGTGGGVPVSGVIVATNGSTSTGAPNAIMTVAGPTMAKPILTASTVISGDIVASSATANRVTATALPSAPLAGLWANLGINRSATTSATLCTTTANATNCDNVVYFNMNRR